MDVYVRVKAAGKRRDVLPPIPYFLPEGINSLRQLLTAVVQQEVAQYNRKEPDVQLIPYLTQPEIDAQAIAGKVSFGRIWSDKKADPQMAVDNAVQCWKDGLVRVMMNDEELMELDMPFEIPQMAVFTFIRLTFLTGTMW